MKNRADAVTIVDGEKTYARARAAFRRPTAGPEEELVERFLEHRPFHLPPGHRLTIFREPRLESGFPDLVAVTWKLTRAIAWNAARAELAASDVRTMHYVFREGPCTHAELATVFSRKVGSCLERLQEAEMIRFTKNKWVSRSLKHSFAVRSIIAVEAKIGDWRSAIQQATLNLWFASASYVLLPRIPRNGQVTEAAERLGLGVWAHGDSLLEHRPTSREQLPRSYASWLFNEWVLRLSEVGEGTPR